MEQQEQQRYFPLMEVVGSYGPYQHKSLIILCLVCCLGGAGTIGNSFIFFKVDYSCPKTFNDEAKCRQYVCKLPKNERKQFLKGNNYGLKTAATEFGDPNCELQGKLAWVQSAAFIGQIIGYIILGSSADNIGRKPSIMLSCFISLTGAIIVSMSQSIGVLGIGRLLLGVGMENAVNISYYMVTQTVDNLHRQKFMAVLAIMYGVGGLMVPVLFFLLKEWRLFTLVFYVTPFIVSLIIVFVYLQETPIMMVKMYDEEKILDSFKKIAIRNQRENEFEESEEMKIGYIKELKDRYKEELKLENKQIFSYFDLFYYGSLRVITIGTALSFFFFFVLYYGPTFILGNFGLGLYLNSIIVQISQILAYIIIYFAIDHLKRKDTALVSFGVCSLCWLIFLFIQKQKAAVFIIFQVLLIFVAKLSISLEYQMIMVYIIELFPTQVGNIGLGLGSIFSTFPGVLMPHLEIFAKKRGISLVVFFVIGGILGILSTLMLPQTFGKRPRQEIEEMEVHVKKSYQEVNDQSI